MAGFWGSVAVSRNVLAPPGGARAGDWLRARRWRGCFANRLTVIVLVPVVFGSGIAAARDERPSVQRVREVLPESLQNVLAGQPQKTAQVEWTLSSFDKYNNGLVERFVTREAGADVWQTNFGDEGGRHRRAFKGAPPADATPEEAEAYMFPEEVTSGTEETLLRGDYLWNLPKAEDPFAGDIQRRADARTDLPVDLAALGLNVSAKETGDAFGLPAGQSAGLEQAVFREHRAGLFDVVTAEWNESRLEWHLDSRVEGLPVEALYYLGDRLVSRSETEYAEIDGRLFPARARFYSGDDARPTQVIDVRRATFDKPWHKQSFDPSDLGLLFGTSFTGLYDDGYGPYWWDGAELITASEYSELVELDGIRPDPRIIEYQARLTDTTVEERLAYMDRRMNEVRAAYYEKYGERPWLEPYTILKPGEKDEWDVYFDKFAAEHKLEGAALEQAKDVLERAKKLRDRYQRKYAAKLKEAEREGDTKKAEYYRGFTQRIFEQVLVRSLERIAARSSKLQHGAGKKD